MTRTILSAMALLAGVIALAGCGGSTSASGTTGGVAGAQHTKKAAGNFRASVHGFEARLQASVQQFQSGNFAGAVTSGGSLLTNCTSFVNGKLAPHATTPAQMKSVTHLRIACGDMAKATRTGMSGNLTKAQAFAKAALHQARIAARLAG